MRMPSQEPSHPIELLAELDAASRQVALALPEQAPALRSWAGIAFRVAGHPFLSPLDEVVETVPSLNVTRAPGAQPWFLGVANHRGDLLPVIDLQLFGGGRPTIQTRRSRLLVIEQHGLRAALLVGEVSGMRHFNEDQLRPVRVGRQPLDRFVVAHLLDDEREWRVFSFDRLAADEQFRTAWIYDPVASAVAAVDGGAVSHNNNSESG